MSITDKLLEEAKKQIAKGTSDPTWVESLMSKASSLVEESELSPESKIASQTAIQVVLANKNSVTNLTAEGLTLFMQHIASGFPQKAVTLYTIANLNADQLIALMNATTDGVIKAKEKLDQANREALELIKEIAIAGAKALLPILLTLI